METKKIGRLLGILSTTGLQCSDCLVQFFLHRLILRDFGSKLDRVDLVVVTEDGDRGLESCQCKVSETVAGTVDWSGSGGTSRDIYGKELEKHRRSRSHLRPILDDGALARGRDTMTGAARRARTLAGKDRRTSEAYRSSSFSSLGIPR